MPNPMRLAAAIAVDRGRRRRGFNLFGSARPGVGGVSSPVTHGGAIGFRANAQPATVLAPIDTTTWTTYTSDRYGFSIGHPAELDERDARRSQLDDSDRLGRRGGWHGRASSILPGNVRVSAWSVAVQPGHLGRGLDPDLLSGGHQPCSGIPDSGPSARPSMATPACSCPSRTTSRPSSWSTTGCTSSPSGGRIKIRAWRRTEVLSASSTASSRRCICFPVVRPRQQRPRDHLDDGGFWCP